MQGLDTPTPTQSGDETMTIHAIEISKVNRIESFDDSKLPEASRVAVFRYGLQQLLDDSHAGATQKAYPVVAEQMAEANRRVNNVLAKIRTGQGWKNTPVSEVLVAQAASGLTDAEMIEAMRLFKAAQSAPVAEAPAKKRA